MDNIIKTFKRPTVTNTTDFLIFLPTKTMTTFEISVTKAMENAMANACRDVSVMVVGELAKTHGFDADDAINTLGLDRFVTKRSSPKGKKSAPKEKMVKPKMPLPFCGAKNSSNCQAIRLNHGLHTQCTNSPMSGGQYCKTCQRGVDLSATGKPTYGTIDDRLAVGVMEFVDPKGKKTIPYANLLEKFGVSQSDVEEEVKKFESLIGSSEIPSEHWTKRETKRGRPKKESTDSDEKKPKKRGRPAKKVVNGNDSDLLSALQAAADSSDNESVQSSTSSRGRPRLSEEEKQRRAQEKAQKKAEKDAQKAEKAKAKAEEKERLKTEKLAARRKALTDEITALNSEVSTQMDLSTMPEDVADLKKMLSDLKKLKKEDDKQAAKDAKAAAKQQAEQDATDKKAAAAKALNEKRDGLIDEINTAATEAGKTVTEFPEKIGELRKMLAQLKREIREAKKQAKAEAKTEAETQEPAETQQPVETPQTVDTQEPSDAELEVEEMDDDEDEEDDEVQEFKHEGMTYLKGSNGVLYNWQKFLDDQETEVVGVWNEENQCIDPAPEDDSEDEDEDEDDE